MRHQLLTAVSLLCASRAELAELAPTINSFIDPAIRKRWTIERACEHNNLKLLRYLIAHEAPDTHPLYRSHVFSLVLVHAVRHDNVEMFACLCAYCPSGYTSKGMAMAAALGKVHLMEWFVAHCDKWLKEQPAVANWHLLCALQHAARSGNLVIVQWLHENVGPATSPFTDRAVQSAMEGGHLDVLKYLVVHGYEYMGSYYKSHVAYAVEAGSLKMAQWLHENGFAAPSINDLQAAFQKGHSNIAKWLLHTIAIPADEQERALAAAAEHCDLEVVQLIHALYPPKRYSNALISAADSGNLDVVEWLFHTAESSSSRDNSTGLAKNRGCGYDYQWVMSKAAAKGHLVVVQWLFHNLRVLCNGRGGLERSAVEAPAGNGHTDVVEWLFSHAYTGDTRPKFDITMAIEHGHLELVQWITARADVDLHMQIVARVATNGHLATPN